MKTIYFGLKNGDVIDQFELDKTYYFVTGKHLDLEDEVELKTFAATCKGVTKRVEYPSVIHLIKNNWMYSATKIYFERNRGKGMTFDEAKIACDKLRQEMIDKGMIPSPNGVVGE